MKYYKSDRKTHRSVKTFRIWICQMLLGFTLSAQTLSDYTIHWGTDDTRWYSMPSSEPSLLSSTGYGRCSMVTPIGFYFPLGNSAYTNFSVTSSGDIVFGDTPLDMESDYSELPLVDEYRGLQAPKINILGKGGYASDSSYIKKTIIGTAPERELIVEFKLNCTQSNTRTVQWQIHLHENGNIEIVFPSQIQHHISQAQPCIILNYRDYGFFLFSNDTLLINQHANEVASYWSRADQYAELINPYGSCPHPIITDSLISTSSIDLSWMPLPQVQEWQVSVNNGPASTTQTPHFAIQDLSPNTAYNIVVTSTCPNTQSPLQINTRTLPDCQDSLSATRYQVGHDINGLWFYDNERNYTHSTIYTANELREMGMSSGLITQIALQWNYAFWPTGSTLTFHMGHTDIDNFDQYYDLSNYVTTTQVIATTNTGSDTGWTYYDLDQAFPYNSDSNLLVLIEYHNDNPSHNPTTTAVASKVSHHVTRQGEITQPTNLRINTRFTMCHHNNGCPSPIHLHTGPIGENQATLAWQPQGDETQWLVAYSTEPLTNYSNATNSIVATAPQITITQLTADTRYYVSVAALCNQGQQSGWSVPTQFFTTCPYSRPLPLHEDFRLSHLDANNNIGVPQCWERPTGDMPTVRDITTRTPEGFNVTIRKGLYFDNETNDQRIILPLLEGIAEARVVLNAISQTSISTLLVGLYSADLDTFVTLDTLNIHPGRYRRYIVPLQHYGLDYNENWQVEIRTPSWALYKKSIIDHLTVERIPDCPDVPDMTVVRQSADYITLAWPADSITDHWRVAYSTVATTRPDTCAFLDANVNMATITDLTPNTEYFIYLQSGCSSLWGEELALLTPQECDSTLTSLTINFDNGSIVSEAIPLTADWYLGEQVCEQIFTASDINQRGLSSGYITRIHIPWSRIWANFNPNHKLYIGSTHQESFASDNDFVPIAQLTLINTNQFIPSSPSTVTVTLAEPFFFDSTSNIVLAITSNGQAATPSHNAGRLSTITGNCYMEDSGMTLYNYNLTSQRTNFIFEICSEPPACSQPFMPTVTDITTYGATLNWMSDNDGMFIVEYGPNGFTPGTGTSIATTDTHLELDMLRHSSSYDVYVRSVCADGDTSLPLFFGFRTECGMIDALPFSEDFEQWGQGLGSPNPPCWHYGSQLSYLYPYVTTDNRMGGSPALKLFAANDQPTYAALPEIDTLAVNIDSAQLRFRVAGINPVVIDGYGGTQPVVTLVVGISDQIGALDGTHFSVIDSIDIPASDNPQWMDIELPLLGFGGNGTFITFVSHHDISIDDVVMEAIPSCPHVWDVTLTDFSDTSATLDWRDLLPQNLWQVEYGATGYTPGNGTQFTVSTHPCTIVGLEASATYDFYVRPICSDHDTGLWSLAPLTMRTLQQPATIPYAYDFEDPEEWSRWETASAMADWYRGSEQPLNGEYSLYISRNGGETMLSDMSTHYFYSMNAACYRDFNFGYNDTSYNISFKASMGGCTLGDFSKLYVLLVDHEATPAPTTNSFTTPWGDVRGQRQLIALSYDTLTHTYSTVIDNVSGYQRLVFYWAWQWSAGIPYVDAPILIDDISIEYASCFPPSQLHTDASSTSATVWWNNVGADYMVRYRKIGEPNYTTFTTHDTIITIHDLSHLAHYEWAVRTICGEGDSSLYSQPRYFTTTMCDEPVTWTIDETNFRTNAGWYDPYFYSSISQTIFDADEIDSVGAINGMAFHVINASGGSVANSCKIWLRHTNISNHDMEEMQDIHTPDCHMVYNGPINYYDTGWCYIMFETPFLWDGQHNVEITFYRHAEGYVNDIFFDADLNHNGFIARNDHDKYINPDSAETMYLYSQSLARPSIRFISCESLCLQPEGLTVSPDHESVTLQWNGVTGVHYQVCIAPDNGNPNTLWTVHNVYDYHITIGGLLPDRPYKVRLRKLCSDDPDDISEWVSASFTTDTLPCPTPTDFRIETDNTALTIYWDGGDYVGDYFCHLYNTVIDTMIRTHQPQLVLHNILVGQTYQLNVKGWCNLLAAPTPDNGSPLTQSGWSDTLTFQLSACDTVSQLSVSSITDSSATISWMGTIDGRWRVMLTYLDAGYGGVVQTLVVDTPSVVFNNLIPGIGYDVFVNNLCGDNYMSNATKVSFSTLITRAETVEQDYLFSIYPNPASGETTVHLSGIEGDVNIVVVDSYGRIVQKATMQCNGDCTHQLQLTHLPAGAYFVCLTSDTVHKTKKLIVR